MTKVIIPIRSLQSLLSQTLLRQLAHSKSCGCLLEERWEEKEGRVKKPTGMFWKKRSTDGAEGGSRGKIHFIIFIYKVNVRVTELTQLTCCNKDMNDQINTGLIQSNDSTVRPSLI